MASPWRIRSSTARRSFVPSRLTRPPLPVIIARTSRSLYRPEKQSRTRSPAGRVPERSALKGPSPSRALLTSTTAPSIWSPTEVASAHVGHDEADLSVGPAALPAPSLGHGLLVQGVEDRAAGEEPVSRDPGDVPELVDHDRVGDIGCDAEGRGYALGDEGAEVARVLPVAGLGEIPQHGGPDPIDPSRQGA